MKERSTGLAGQVVIVTGASSGIGEATARWLARGGAHVVLAARRRERLQGLVDQISAGGGSALAIAGDVTSAEDRAQLVRRTVDEFGRIDGLVNNAGYGHRGPLEIVPVDDMRRNFETNLFSLIALTQLVIPIMRAQRSGRIVNVSSVAGRIARPFSAVYDATKHALEAISDGLRVEVAPFGIQVVVIQPGFIWTEFAEVADEVSRVQLEDAGPYAARLDNLRQEFDRMRWLAGKPDDIARLVEKALVAEHPRTRYAAPLHAHLALAAKRILPQRVFDRVLEKRSRSPR